MARKTLLSLLLCLTICTGLLAQTTANVFLPEWVFDGTDLHQGWAVKVEGNQIVYAGPVKNLAFREADDVREMPGQTLLPGLIEGHAHLLLYPYNQTDWNDQVLKESPELRAIRGAKHAEATLLAGWTTVRDLGSEGAGYADVAIKEAIEQGIIVGPRLLVAGPALVATGSYGPKDFHPGVHVPLGAEEADGDNLIPAVRRQIGHGADIIKVYADYRWGPNGEAMPTFSLEELKLIVETAASSGRPTVAHASTAEGMRRATLAGVQTIEHGDGGTAEVFSLMRDHGVALCPTLAAGDAIMQYRGWNKGTDAEPERIVNKRASFSAALAAGVPLVAGGDVGVFVHGDNVRELEMMVDYGMKVQDVLRTVTSGNANLLALPDRGKIEAGHLADLIVVEGRPDQDISALRAVQLVMKDGVIYQP